MFRDVRVKAFGVEVLGRKKGKRLLDVEVFTFKITIFVLGGSNLEKLFLRYSLHPFSFPSSYTTF